MSYILDALKRAERERKQGQVSVLDEVPAGTAAQRPGGPSRPWLWLALGAVASGLLVYALTAWHRHTGAAAPPQPATVAAAPAVPPAAPVAVPQPAPAAAPAPPAAAAVQAPAAAPAPPSATIENPDRIGSVEDVVGARPPPASAPQKGPTPAPSAQAQAGESTAAAPPEAAPPAEPAQAPAPADEMPALKEMPDAYRAQFPLIAVDVHAYDANPQHRFVLINGKRYKEGDTLAEGPRIVAIVAEGIVFEWQGHKVLYATGR